MQEKRPSSRDDGGISWVFSSYGASVGFLTRYNGKLSETLVLCQGSQVSMHVGRGTASLLSSHDGHLLEPTLWPKGCQASCEVWREDLGLLSRPCRKRWPSSRDDGGSWGVFSSCGTSVGFHTRYDRELREPLVRRQRSQASMRVARQIASLLWSHGRD